MRGTLDSTHSSLLNRQAASSGKAEFLLPSTATLPDSRRPPSINSVDIEVPEVDDFVAQLDAERRSDAGPAGENHAPDVAGRRRSVVDDEVGVGRRHPSATDRQPLQPGPI